MTELQEEMAESNVATQEPIVAEEKPQIDESKSSAATQEPIVAEEKPQIDEPEISAATQEPIVAEEKPQIDEPERIRKLFIGGLSFQTTTQALKDFYSKFGNVVDCFVAINKETGQPRGYGFVTMSSKAGVS
jgi:RNA recognition motif-containing protein